ncbi:NAD(P)-dependent alcohol dehydrogenase [Nonomuraea sp. NPDC046802]|uniref:NAD(P)-dependent alcohol dehydrogenase n=1 Tax=Nonomuraea sp. NPDC046802 TaxID=3154919 RepID=UPI0033E4F9F9
MIDEDFVLKIPESLDLARVAPLLCAGVTLYSPLRHWNAGPGTKVAIVGMGGLGHVGVKIAHAMGAQVTVLSRTLSKKDDGLRMGAEDYYATSDPATFEKLAGQFDLVINTVSESVDLTPYVHLLDVDGTLVNVGAPAEPLRVDAQALITGRRGLAGSANGGIPETQEMLEFCAEHGILPETELIAASSINDAYERLLNADVRYRFVIDIKTLA